MIGDITYIDDSPNFDQSNDDDVIRIEANHAEQSIVSLQEEDLLHQLGNNSQPIHTIYDTDEESLESLEVSKGSLTLCSTSFHSIRNNFHVIGNQQPFWFNVEVEEDDELLEKVVNEKPSPKMV